MAKFRDILDTKVPLFEGAQINTEFPFTAQNDVDRKSLKIGILQCFRHPFGWEPVAICVLH